MKIANFIGFVITMVSQNHWNNLTLEYIGCFLGGSIYGATLVYLEEK